MLENRYLEDMPEEDDDFDLSDLISDSDFEYDGSQYQCIQNVTVISKSGKNKRVTIVRNANGEITSVTERDLILDLF